MSTSHGWRFSSFWLFCILHDICYLFSLSKESVLSSCSSCGRYASIPARVSCKFWIRPAPALQQVFVSCDRTASTRNILQSYNRIIRTYGIVQSYYTYVRCNSSLHMHQQRIEYRIISYTGTPVLVYSFIHEYKYVSPNSYDACDNIQYVSSNSYYACDTYGMYHQIHMMHVITYNMYHQIRMIHVIHTICIIKFIMW